MISPVPSNQDRRPAPLRTGPVRLVAAASATGFLAVALTIRAAADGALEQHSGTALYASIVYAAVVFLRPPLPPVTVAGLAVGFCWLVETAQLTGIPAALSYRSLVARLVLGVQFDPMDLAWYPVGVIPLAALHWWLASGERGRFMKPVRRVW